MNKPKTISLLAACGLAWIISAAGCNLFYHDDNKGQCVIEELCTDWQFITIDKEPAWSPDGQTIAFFRSDTNPEKEGIYIIDSNGDNLQKFHSGGGSAPSWSPDGKWIAFYQNAQIYKKHVEKDSLVQLTFSGRNFYPSWSPDGKWIVYDRSVEDETGPGGIWIMKSDGSQKEHVFGGGFPDWHPNGLSIAAVVGTSATSAWKRFKVYTINNGLTEILDAVVDANNLHPKYSPDGRKIVFTSQLAKGGHPQIWLINADDTNTIRLTENGGWIADWSPDGQWIVYTETFDTGRLWLMKPDGSEKRQLTFD